MNIIRLGEKVHCAEPEGKHTVEERAGDSMFWADSEQHLGALSVEPERECCSLSSSKSSSISSWTRSSAEKVSDHRNEGSTASSATLAGPSCSCSSKGHSVEHVCQRKNYRGNIAVIINSMFHAVVAPCSSSIEATPSQPA